MAPFSQEHTEAPIGLSIFWSAMRKSTASGFGAPKTKLKMIVNVSTLGHTNISQTT